ncbi:hypothetical protein H4R35_000214 [Dimargaris xerosporica]|nr:hypothetical protein H4R35_000214 [Dimargaris xerosporica]
MSAYNSNNYSEHGIYGSQNQQSQSGTRPDSTGYSPANYSQGAYVAGTAKPPPPSNSSQYSQGSGYGSGPQSGGYGSQGSHQSSYGHGQHGYQGQHGQQPPHYGSTPNQPHGGYQSQDKPQGGSEEEEEDSHSGWKTAGTVAAGALAAGAAVWGGKKLYDMYEEKQQLKKPQVSGPNEPWMPGEMAMQQQYQQHHGHHQQPPPYGQQGGGYGGYRSAEKN